MKKLFLMRHGKSDWADAGLSDFDRPLNPRGISNAPEMGKRLLDKWGQVEKIYCSKARRTIETGTYVCESLDFNWADVEQRKDMYLASASKLREVAEETDDSINSILLIAHNPGMDVLMNALSRHKIGSVPTCGLGYFEFDIDSWKHFDPVLVTHWEFDYPKNTL